MKRSVVLGVTLFFLWCFFTLTVSAGVYIDDMSRPETTTAKNYTNLVVTSTENILVDAMDRYVMMIENPINHKGEVIYQVQNGRKLQVRIYSPTGTCVLQLPTSEYHLGYALETEKKATSLIPLYSPSADSVYLMTPKGTQKLMYEKFKGYQFQSTTEQPQDTLPYGLVIWGSSDGKSYQQLSRALGKTQQLPESHWVMEEWVTILPPSIKYVKIEINDYKSIQQADGTMAMKKPQTMTMLASVRIEGESLILGTNESVVKNPDIKPPTPSESSSQENSSTDKKPEKVDKPVKEKVDKPSKTSSKAVIAKEPKVTTTKTTKKEPISKIETPKFTGVITPSVPKTKKSMVSSKKEIENSSATESKETTSKKEEKTEELPVVHYVEATQPKKDNFGKGVLIYIVFVTVFLLFLLLKPKKT